MKKYVESITDCGKRMTWFLRAKNLLEVTVFIPNTERKNEYQTFEPFPVISVNAFSDLDWSWMSIVPTHFFSAEEVSGMIERGTVLEDIKKPLEDFFGFDEDDFGW